MKKVTTHNLDQVTAQEVFDHVGSHLIRQGECSYIDLEDSSSCAYRGKEGLMCAAGCLIHDADYDAKMEGETWFTITRDFGISNNWRILIGDLQSLHDSENSGEWIKGLTAIASTFKLSMEQIDAVQKELLA